MEGGPQDPASDGFGGEVVGLDALSDFAEELWQGVDPARIVVHEQFPVAYEFRVRARPPPAAPHPLRARGCRPCVRRVIRPARTG